MVAPEDRQEEGTFREVRETVRAPIHPGQREIGRRIPGPQSELREFGHAAASRRGFLSFGADRWRERYGTMRAAAADRPGPPSAPLSVEVPVDAQTYVCGDARLLRVGRMCARVGVLGERCLSYGVGVRGAPPYLRRASGEGIPTVRRDSGGSALLHEPGDLAWSIVLPRTDPRVGNDFARAYGRLGTGVVRFLSGQGIASRWTEAPGLVAEYCTLSGRGCVLSAGGKIVGGAAQHLAGGALLHHGTVSVTVDRSAIDRLFALGPEGPTERLGGLRELGAALPSATLARSLGEAIVRELAGGSPR